MSLMSLSLQYRLSRILFRNYFCHIIIDSNDPQVGLLLEALGRGGEEEHGKRGMGGKLFHLRRKKVHCLDDDGDDDDSGLHLKRK